MARSSPDTTDERIDSPETLCVITGGGCALVTGRQEGEN